MKEIEERIEDIQPESTKPHTVGNGFQRLYRFRNSFGASVIRFKIGGLSFRNGYGSYTNDETEFEVAVIKYDGDDYKLTYDTPITNDVLGHVGETGLQRVLRHIRHLNKSGNYRGKGYPTDFHESYSE